MDAAPASTRLLSLDTYRGLVLLLLCFEGPNWGWQEPIAEAYPGNLYWEWLIAQTHHTTWVGCTLWDLIQPSFMFMVGVSMAYSYAKRARLSESRGKMFRHACLRAFVLILLGVFLRSVGAGMTYWTFEDVLTQIGLGYVFLFLLWGRSMRTQWISAGAVLFGYWLLFALSPIRETAGNPEGHPMFEGFLAHWNLNANPAHAFDVWFLNLFPREEAFVFHPDGYNTLNFIPSLATMIFGLVAGEFIRSDRPARRKLKVFLVWGVAGIALGLLLHATGICPLVKKTWTPAFTLFSGGACFLILAALYGVIDLAGVKRWTFPLVVLGMNSIALYVMIHLFPDFLVGTARTHLGENFAAVFGQPFQPMIENLFSAFCLWWICYWMYRRKLFLRI